MPPHCDSLDGPVVRAAREALAHGDVDMVLPYVHADGEAEIRAMFDLVLQAHGDGGIAAQVAERLLFETVVRVHRAGEGAPYTGLKPAGLDVGPVIPLAEEAVALLDAGAVVEFLTTVLAEQLNARMQQLKVLDAARDGTVGRERDYVEAMLNFEVYSHHLYKAMRAVKLH